MLLSMCAMCKVVFFSLFLSYTATFQGSLQLKGLCWGGVEDKTQSLAVPR